MEENRHDERFELLTDEEIVAFAQNGDDEALTFLLDKYKNFVRSKARSYFLIGADHEDIVQEGMIGLFKAIRDFKSSRLSSFRAFAELCVKRQIITAIKTATRQKHFPLNSYVSLNKPLYDEESDRTLLDSKAGFQGALTKNAYNALAKNKNLYLSTDRGVVLMNLDAYRPEKRSYRLMVSAIKLDGKTVPIERGSGLTIGRDINSIEFIPEIVNYFPDNPKVSYYLEGIDSGYKTVAQNDLSGIVYTNLASGEYTFHLALIDEESGNVREESTYGFIKEKSIYDNAWFLIYMLVVGGLFIGWLAWFLTKRRALRALAAQQEKLALALKQVQMGNETILAIAKTVDAKDSMTSQHSQRVSEYSVLISEKLGFSAAERENLRKAALLHDIGKIGIPDSILNKPDRLTDKEYAVMKTHVTRGAEILKDFTLIEHVVEGAKYHHERYDGRGYPDGLKGGDIPLYGRIIAIADAFDAMTANRVYRKRLAFSLVLEELRKGRGTQFDPELLDLFLAVIDSGGIDTEALYADEAPEEKEAAAHDA